MLLVVWMRALLLALLLPLPGPAVAAPDRAALCAAQERNENGVPAALVGRLARGFNLTGWIEGDTPTPPGPALLRRLLARLDGALRRLLDAGFTVSLDMHPGERFGALHRAEPERALAQLDAAWAVLATAPLCALIAYLRTAERYALRDFFAFAIPHEVMVHPSARADVMFWITRRVPMPFLMRPAGITFVVAVGYATSEGLGALLGIGQPILGEPGPVTVLTLTMLVAYDLSCDLYHTAQHCFPFLWELHKVHHSAEVMIGITKDRVHPLDELMNRAWDGVIPGIRFGIWTLVALDPVEVTVFGVDVYVMRNILTTDFVRRTHFKISFGARNHVVLCPHRHQLHHSTDPRHYHKNFGLLFSFWDRLFGTLCVPKPDEDSKFGIMDRDAAACRSLSGLYILPPKKMGRHIVRFARRLRGQPDRPRRST